MTKFNLSEKIIKLTDKEGECNWISCICRDDIKEFIRLLEKRNTIKHQITIDDVKELAGEELTK